MSEREKRERGMFLRENVTFKADFRFSWVCDREWGREKHISREKQRKQMDKEKRHTLRQRVKNYPEEKKNSFLKTFIK